MEDINRRSALALGLVTAATLPALFTPTPAFAQRYRPDEGKELAPGVRRIDLTKRESQIPAYATVSMRDIVYQPGSKSDNPAMMNDMVCLDLKFVAKTGDVWSCKKGMPEANVNNGSTVAIMRVADRGVQRPRSRSKCET